MFLGQHEHAIDDKNRLTIPSRFREGLADGLVLARGLDRNIDVYPVGTWEASVQARLAELDPFSGEARRLRRFVFSGAVAEALDKQGRVLVPPALARHAGLGKDVVVAGLHDHVEVWDRLAWETHMNAVEGSAGDAAERLAEKRS